MTSGLLGLENERISKDVIVWRCLRWYCWSPGCKIQHQTSAQSRARSATVGQVIQEGADPSRRHPPLTSAADLDPWLSIHCQASYSELSRYWPAQPAWAQQRVRSKRKWQRPLEDANPRHTLVWAGTSCDRLPKTVGHTVHTRAWVNMKSNRVNKKQSNIKGFLSPSIAQGLWAELHGGIWLPLSVLSLFHDTRKHWRLQTR